MSWKEVSSSEHKLAAGEAYQSVVVDVDTQRVVASHVDVQPQVEFGFVDQVGPRDVTLHDDLAAFRNLTPLVNDANANPAGGGGLSA